MTLLFRKQSILPVILALTAFMARAQIQTPLQTPAEVPEKSAAASNAQAHVATAGVVSAANTEPRYAAGDLARAFTFMDGNKDGKVSRDEASGFRNVAKHFDAADTNRDAALSLEEFSSAMNRPKSP